MTSKTGTPYLYEQEDAELGEHLRLVRAIGQDVLYMYATESSETESSTCAGITLTRKQAAALRRALGKWLQRTPKYGKKP